MATTANLGLTKLSERQAQKEATINENMEILDAAVSGGTSFPLTPATNRRFFRSDRNIEYFYNGTRWLSTQLYSDSFPRGDAAALPHTATIIGAERLAAPWAGVYDIWMEQFQLVFVIVGGTALSASHKWVTVLTKLVGGTPTTLATITIDSGALSAWRTSAATINALLGVTAFAFAVDHTKTGTPGSFYTLPRLVYRLVG